MALYAKGVELGTIEDVPDRTDAEKRSLGSSSMEYNTNMRNEAAKRHKSETDTGVPCSEGTGCAGFLKNGVVLHGHPNPKLGGRCGECQRRMLAAARAKGGNQSSRAMQLPTPV